MRPTTHMCLAIRAARDRRRLEEAHIKVSSVVSDLLGTSARRIQAPRLVDGHRLCRLIWKILHQTVRYDERGPAVSVAAKKVRTRKMIRELRTSAIASS